MAEERILLPEKVYIGLPKTRGPVDQLYASMTAWGTDSSAKGRMGTVDRYSDKQLTVANTPMAGFALGRWHGSDEWGIVDPRGFTTLVSASYVNQLLDTVTVINKQIMEPCIWGRAKGTNVLLNTQSDQYQLAVIQTQVANSKESWKKASIGNQVTLTNGIQGIYLGKYFRMESNWRRGNRPGTFVASEGTQYAILKQAHGKHWKKTIVHELHLINNPKLARIDTQDTMSVVDAEMAINQHLINPATAMSFNSHEPFMLSAERFTKDPEITLEVHPDAGNLTACKEGDHETLIETVDGNVGFLTSPFRRQDHKIQLLDKQALFKDKIFHYLTEPAPKSWGRQQLHSSTSIKEQTITDQDVNQAWRIQITYTSTTGNVLSRYL